MKAGSELWGMTVADMYAFSEFGRNVRDTYSYLSTFSLDKTTVKYQTYTGKFCETNYCHYCSLI